MKYENIPRFIREMIAGTWLRKVLLKLYLLIPRKAQYVLAKFGARVFLHKKRAQLEEFSRQ